MGCMSKSFQAAVEHVSELPVDVQDRIAELMLGYAKEEVYMLSAEERAAIAEADAQIARAEVLSDAETEALFRELQH